MIQTNDEHQRGVAELAGKFAADFDMAAWGEVVGLLHDKGKEKRAFQEHIMRNSGYRPEVVVNGNKDHAVVGALIAKQLFPQFHLLMDNVLMGHHRGLYDEEECQQKLRETEMPTEIDVQPINIQLPLPRLGGKEDVHHLVRMLYSCLVDADFLDTESFMLPEQHRLRVHTWDMRELLGLLQRHLAQLSSGAPRTAVNEVRQYVQQQCVAQGSGATGFYSLTVPTGGGKTLASVLWALHHAVAHDLQHIIIGIPYTSIIEQTAQTLKSIFGEENVLEHHSNFDYEQIGDRDMRQRMKLATENWDYPIIVTTNVQLFESLFSNKPSQCRKIHNLARSVIILDEVQTLSMECLRPIVDTLNTLHRVFGSSVLFTTASQPILSGKIDGANYTANFRGLPGIHEIIPRKARLHDRLRRVTLQIDESPKSADEVASLLARHNRVLCIVNTRRDAKEIFEHLPDDGANIHLSRMMCPAHIKQSLQTIKEQLSRTDARVRVVATQLIEAGVDVDFPVVYRQQAGLDSILQAAGRCNREGRMPLATTHVFALDRALPPGAISKSNNARLNMVGDFDWFSQEAMTEYFRQLHAQYDNFDKFGCNQLLYNNQPQYEEIGKSFRLIEDNTTPVIINWGESNALISQLKSGHATYGLLKKLGQYSVNVRRRDLQQLLQMGAVEQLLEGVYYAPDPRCYDTRLGLVTDNFWINETYII